MLRFINFGIYIWLLIGAFSILHLILNFGWRNVREYPNFFKFLIYMLVLWPLYWSYKPPV